jgi:hypothetical protein
MVCAERGERQAGLPEYNEKPNAQKTLGNNSHGNTTRKSKTSTRVQFVARGLIPLCVFRGDCDIAQCPVVDELVPDSDRPDHHGLLCDDDVVRSIKLLI